jgi:hypothetical protein
MTTTQDMTSAAPPDPVHIADIPAEPDSRLVLWDIQKKRHEYDGIWWPRSRDLAAEVPALNAALHDRCGPLAHVMFNLSAWESTPRRLRLDRQRIRLGGFYTLQPSLLIVTGNDGRRVDLLVVPPETDPGLADALIQLPAAGAVARATELGIVPGPGERVGSAGALSGLDLNRGGAHRRD